MGLKVITEPTEEPVDLAETKLWIRYTQTLQDDVITALITAARRYVEKWTNRTLVTTTYEYYLEDLFLDHISSYNGGTYYRMMEIPTSTIQSITSITYIDDDDAEQTLASTVYGLDNVSMINKVYLLPDQSVPSVNAQPNAVKITFDAGYGAATAVPEDLKTAIKMMVGFMFEQREAMQEQDLKNNPAIQQLLNLSADYRF